MRNLTLPFLLLLLLVAPPAAHAAPGDDTGARVAQLRTLLSSAQGAAILDLLGDPKVRDAVLHDDDPPAAAPSEGHRATAGQVMDTMLTGVRARLWSLATEFAGLSDELLRAWARVQSQLPGSELLRLLGLLIAFLAGGIGAQMLFFRLVRPWREHFMNLNLHTPRERASAVGERLLFGTLYLAAFVAGSMGAFLLFAWPPLTGSIILGYLVAFIEIRLAMTVTRFFCSPGAERVRLLPLSTTAAWFWHRWIARLVAIGAIGWQTILMLRMFGLSQPTIDFLIQLLLLLLTLLGVFVLCSAPPPHEQCARPTRGPMLRLVLSLGLVTDWLLFLMGGTALGLTLLVLAAIPLAVYVFGRSIAVVMLGRWCPDCREQSAHVAFAQRTAQALIVILAAASLLSVWQIDMTEVTAMDTPMTRIVRGLLEALVILVISDLLWQVVRLLIDSRLAGGAALIDDMDDEALRRQARLRTLLPVLRNFAMFIVLVMASLSALAAMGLQIGPLLAGAGVVGIAVGFGAQTLVRDIISGIFFLLDDAFRVGEYVESAGIRGTVESFSLRSVKLRHLNGQLHTVPFGDLKAITNYSRDWVVEILHVVVTYETDLDILDSAVEMVSADLMAEPSMASEFIEPLRSLGVQAMVDTGMQIGLTFKTRPGHQYALRRAVFGRIRVAFVTHGIRFASAALPSIAAEAAATA
jgi:small-conductance mechanosensitive channel